MPDKNGLLWVVKDFGLACELFYYVWCFSDQVIWSGGSSRTCNDYLEVACRYAAVDAVYIAGNVCNPYWESSPRLWITVHLGNSAGVICSCWVGPISCCWLLSMICGDTLTNRAAIEDWCFCKYNDRKYNDRMCHQPGVTKMSKVGAVHVVPEI